MKSEPTKTEMIEVVARKPGPVGTLLYIRWFMLRFSKFRRRLGFWLGIALACFGSGGFLFSRWEHRHEPSLGITADLVGALIIGVFGFIVGWLPGRVFAWVIDWLFVR